MQLLPMIPMLVLCWFLPWASAWIPTPCLATRSLPLGNEQSLRIPCHHHHTPSTSTSSSSSSSLQSSAVNHERDLASLIQWAKDHGVITNQLDLSETGVPGCFGVSAAADTPQGTRVLMVPSSLILSSERIMAELKNEDLRPALQHIENTQYRSQLSHFILFLKILMEHEKGSKSLWYPWLESLPRTFDTAIAMDEVELDCLPPYAWALANIERRHLHVFRTALSFIPESILPAHVTSDKELTKWAFQVVFTRAWRYPDTRKDAERCDIVPFGDMFNHNANKNLDLDYDQDDNFCAYTGQNVTAGSALEISYGRPTNPYRFLAIFGFCDTGMPEIFSQITLENPSQKHQDLGYDLDAMVFRTQDGAISSPVWDVLLYSILEQKPEIQEQFYQAHMQGDKETKQRIHGAFYLETCLTLKKHVDRTLAEVDGLLAKIDRIMSTTNTPSTDHPRLGLIRLNNEFVRIVFAKVKQRVDGMIQAEVLRRREAVPSGK